MMLQEAAGTQAAAAAAKPPAKAGSSNSVFARFGSNILQRTGFFGGKSSTEVCFYVLSRMVLARTCVCGVLYGMRSQHRILSC